MPFPAVYAPRAQTFLAPNTRSGGGDILLSRIPRQDILSRLQNGLATDPIGVIFVDAVGKPDTVAHTTSTITAPASVQPGDMLLMFVHEQGSAGHTFSADTGFNTPTDTSPGQSSTNMALWAKTADGTEANATVTVTSSNSFKRTIIITCWRPTGGAILSVDAFLGALGSTVNSAAPSVTTMQDHDALVTFHGIASAAARTWTGWAGSTQGVAIDTGAVTSGSGSVMFYQADAGTAGATGTLTAVANSPANFWGAYTVTIKANAPAGYVEPQHMVNGDFGTFEANITGWGTGGSVPPTLSQSTAQAHGGTNSLLITWGTGGSFPLAGADTDALLVIGAEYQASAWVYVPTGNPGVQIAVGGIGLSAVSTTFDAWTQITYQFIATATSHNIQIWPGSSPTSGQVAYVDDVTVYSWPTANMTATPTMTVGGLVTEIAAASLTAGPTMTVAAVDTSFGVATMSAAPTLTATALDTSFGTASLTAAPTLTASGVLTRIGTASLTAAPTLTAAGIVIEVAAAALSAAPTLTAAALDTSFGVASLHSAPTLTAAAIDTSFGVVSMTAAPTLTAAGVILVSGAASLSATATLTVAGIVIEVAAASLSATATMTVAGSVTEIASASLTAAPTLTAAALDTSFGIAALSAAPTLTAAGVVVKLGAASLSAAPTMTVSAIDIVIATATLSANATMTIAGSVTEIASAALSSAPTITVAGSVTEIASASLSASPTMTVVALDTLFGVAALSAAPTLTASGTVAGSSSAANLTATATLTVAGSVIDVASVSLSAAPTLTVAGFVYVQGGYVNLLDPDLASGNSLTKASFSGGTYVVSSSTPINGANSFLGTANGTGDLRLNNPINTFMPPANPGDQFYGAATIKNTSGTSYFVNVYVEFFQSNFTYISSQRVFPQQSVAAGQQITFEGLAFAVAPALSAFAHLLVIVTAPANGATFLVDDLVLANVTAQADNIPVFSASPTMTIAALDNSFGTAALSAAPTLSATGVLTRFGTATLTASATMTFVGTVTDVAAVSLHSAPTLTVSAFDTAFGTVSLTSAPTFTVSGVIGKFGAASLTAVPTLTVSGVIVVGNTFYWATPGGALNPVAVYSAGMDGLLHPISIQHVNGSGVLV